jgi:hypothetical protein
MENDGKGKLKRARRRRLNTEENKVTHISAVKLIAKDLGTIIRVLDALVSPRGTTKFN